MKTLKTLVLISSVALGAVLSACTLAPGGNASLPAISIDPSVPAAGTEAVITILNELDSAIASNQTSTGLTPEEQQTLQAMAATIRSAVETGDLSSAQPAFDELSDKVDELAAKLNTDAGASLREAVAQLRTLLAGS